MSSTLTSSLLADDHGQSDIISDSAPNNHQTNESIDSTAISHQSTLTNDQPIQSYQSPDISSKSSKVALFRENLPPLLKLATPVVVTYLLQNSLNLVNLIFIGQLSAIKLAGAALGNMAVTVSGYAVIYGFATSVDTLSSQAFGSGHLQLVGLTAQRCGVILMIICLPILLLWWFMDEVLIACGQEVEISRLAGQYAWTLAYSLPALCWYEVLKKYMICQSKLKPLVIVLIATNFLNILLVYLFIHQFGFDFRGGPMATMVSQWTMMVLTYVACYYTGIFKESWPALSKDIFKGWLPITKLGSAGVAMLMAEWCSFEFCSFMAGWVGHIELDAFVVLLQVQSIMFMLPFGIGIACSTMIGNNLGAGRPEQAKWSGITGVSFALAVELVLIIIFVSAIDGIAAVFSNDQLVVDMVVQASSVTACMLIFDCLQATSTGLLRGVGLQRIGAVTNVLGYYLIGLPIAVLLTFHYHLHVVGLITGLLIAVFVTTCVFFFTLWNVNWQEESDKAVARAKAEAAQMSSKSDMVEFQHSSEPDHV